MTQGNKILPTKPKEQASIVKPKPKKKEPRNSSNVAARNRRARMEAVIGEKQVQMYVKVIDKIMTETDELKKSVKNSKMRKDTLKSVLGLFDFLREDLTKEELKVALIEAINNVLKAQENELATTVIKAETQNKLNQTILKTKFKLLAKVFPDLRAIEISDPDGGNPFSSSLAALVEATKK